MGYEEQRCSSGSVRARAPTVQIEQAMIQRPADR